jgi:hypothetical protein
MIDIVHLINDTYQLIQFDDKGEIETIWFQGSLSDCRIYKIMKIHDLEAD